MTASLERRPDGMQSTLRLGFAEHEEKGA